jgi:hypothetical protein
MQQILTLHSKVKFITEREDMMVVGWDMNWWDAFGRNLLENGCREAAWESQCSHHYRISNISSWKICVTLIYAHWLFLPASPSCLQRLLLVVKNTLPMMSSWHHFKISQIVLKQMLLECTLGLITIELDCRFQNTLIPLLSRFNAQALRCEVSFIQPSSHSLSNPILC